MSRLQHRVIWPSFIRINEKEQNHLLSDDSDNFFLKIHTKICARQTVWMQCVRVAIAQLITDCRNLATAVPAVVAPTTRKSGTFANTL